VSSDSGIWLYAVTDGTAPIPDASLTGVGGGQLHLVADGRLTAVAEMVSLAEFGEVALRRNLEDLTWLESMARAHHRVIEAAARQVPLVPLRLATVYRDDGRVQAMLAQHGAQFADALRRTASRAEWGVKAFAAEPAAAHVGTVGVDESQGPSAPGTGAAYLRRRRDELSANRRRKQETLESARRVHADLVRLAADARLHPPQSPQLTGGTSAMVLNAAYLVDDHRAAEFGQAVDDLRARLSLRLELTGPWPAYSFTEAGPAPQ
jgi:hypothetical protein